MAEFVTGKVVVTAFVVLVVLYAIVALVAASLQRSMIYPAPPEIITPSFPGAEVLKISGADDREVVALYHPARPGNPTVVYFHGNAEQLASTVSLGEDFVALGFGFFAVEYPGYGLASAGKTTEENIYTDGAAALEHAKRHLSVSTEEMLLVGRSLGTGVAVEMARRGYGGALVLLSPYTSMVAMARRTAPWLPVSLLLRDRFDSVSKADKIELPCLVIHGSADELIPAAMGREVAERLPHARLIELPTAGHNDLFVVAGSSLVETIADFGRSAR